MRAGTGRPRGRRSDGVEVRAGQLAELGAEERPAPGVPDARIEMLLKDLVGGARGKGVTVRRQIGAGDRPGDRRRGRRDRVGRYNCAVLEPAADVATRIDG